MTNTSPLLAVAGLMFPATAIAHSGAHEPASLTAALSHIALSPFHMAGLALALAAGAGIVIMFRTRIRRGWKEKAKLSRKTDRRTPGN
ncbi:MAG: hypothetical protein JJ902_04845 [Roseibium sp.]|nr:hypothetical protein [Roseibium sp.]